MDHVDHEILACLTENARIKVSDISRKINLSVSAVIERIKKLEASGVIERYTTILDQQRLGNDITALMGVSLEHPTYYEAFTAMVQDHPNIQVCYYLTGEFDFMLTILTDSSASLEKIHSNIKNMTGVQSTKTFFVLKSVKNDVTLLPKE